MANDLTAQRLREVVAYDEATGVFTSRIARGGRSKPVGSQLGCKNSAGYDRIMIDGVSYLSHRLAWLYVTGEWPEAEIDHISGDQQDNRFANLRPASREENCRNTRLPRHNRSGIKGVSSRKGKWVAMISAGGKQSYLGSFDDKAAAAAAYREAAGRLHGKFARAA